MEKPVRAALLIYGGCLFAFASAVGGQIRVESPVLRDRLSRPQDYFLLDGFTSRRVDPAFYQRSQGAGRDSLLFLWPSSNSSYGISPERGWEWESSPLSLGFLVGNEVGDPHLQEILPETAVRNHTPFTRTTLNWSPLKRVRAFASFDQNDHFSYRTLPSRARLVPAPDMTPSGARHAWFGENLPAKSLAQLGASISTGPAYFNFNGNAGWWWITSPASGMSYPWEGQNLEIDYGQRGRYSLAIRSQAWRSPSHLTFYRNYWSEQEMGFNLMGSKNPRLAWEAGIGYKKMGLESDSSFEGRRFTSYPLKVTHHSAFGEPWEGTKFAGDGAWNYRDGMFSGDQSLSLEGKRAKHAYKGRIHVYYRHPLEAIGPVWEHFPFDSTFQSVFSEGDHQRGADFSANHDMALGPIRLGFSGGQAMEWGAPVFDLERLEKSDGLVLRSGRYVASDHVLMNIRGEATLGVGTGEKDRLGHLALHVGGRRFYGKQVREMEFSPSPWWAGANWRIHLPSNLGMDLRLHYMGPKAVRQWTEAGEFRVPAHWENHFALTQGFLDNRLKLNYSALHVFGEEVLEHPNGNPLRFRILVGADWKF